MGRSKSNVDVDRVLAHWGIKGMKWGVRRDVGPDGRVDAVKKLDAKELDAANRDRIKSGKTIDLRSSKDARDASFVRSKAKISGVPTLTNKQLELAIKRMNLEVQYSQLKQAQADDSVLGKGKRVAGGILRDVTVDTLSSWLKRPGSNMSGQTSAKAKSWLGQQPIIDGTVIQRAIGS